MASLKLSDYAFDLPEQLIAQQPAPERDESRLLVVRRDSLALEHRRFRDLVDYLEPGDLLVLNDTKVLPARLYGTRATGARIEVLLLEETAPAVWVAMVRPGRKAQVGERIDFAAGFHAEVLEVLPDGTRRVRLVAARGDVRAALALYGALPLPPYINPEGADESRYQTVFARDEGAVAAPTAGLHFTPALLDRIRERGVGIATVTLHVGAGTFKPVTEEDVSRHVMHAERYVLPAETVERIRETKAAGRRVVAVGTTVARTLEHAACSGELQPGAGETAIFIVPGFRFHAVDALVTNFHLPQSTLLMLVAAFVEQVRPQGREAMLRVYREAIAHGYRFYSFGDATLML